MVGRVTLLPASVLLEDAARVDVRCGTAWEYRPLGAPRPDAGSYNAVAQIKPVPSRTANKSDWD